MFAFIGIILVVGACVCIKLFDKWIRERQWAKASINIAVIGGSLLTITGLLYIIFK